MIITSLVDDISTQGMPTEHGLSLHIRLTNGQTILFDMGQSDLFLRNAQRLGIDITHVDTAIVSHGHYDHGGGLKTFIDINPTAPIYIHQDAFQPHYSLRDEGLTYIGLDSAMHQSSRLVPCGAVTAITSDMTLFADVPVVGCYPGGNRLLFGPDPQQHDLFSHEQHLVIHEDNRYILIAGCAHRGIGNIVRRCSEIIGQAPDCVLAGMHMVKSGLDARQQEDYIHQVAAELMNYRTTCFYTMHCTGTDAYTALKTVMGEQINYLSCGQQTEIKK